MVGDDPRRLEAADYILRAIKALRAVQAKRLDHDDLQAVNSVLQGLVVVQRSMAVAHPDDAKFAARLQQVATQVQSCIEPEASAAYWGITSAAGIFQAMADGN